MMCENPWIRVPKGVGRGWTYLDEEIRESVTPFPCGKCKSCRINQSRIWKSRILLEARSHVENCFVTLTYNDWFLPEDKSVCKESVKKFLKRLRRNLNGREIRYFMVGEYGSKSWRPHYHGALFGVSPFEQDVIEKSWSVYDQEIGFVSTGDLNSKSAGYMCGYVVKDMRSDKDKRLIERGLMPEFMMCSKQNGGLGHEAIERIAKRVGKNSYLTGKVLRELVINGKTLPLGRYLTQKFVDTAGIDKSVLDNEFYEYQERLFDQHLRSGEYFRNNVVDEKEVQRFNRDWNEVIFPRVRKL